MHQRIAQNVVFIHTDQQRFDTLGCNGAPEAQTPNLDRLASGGLNFTNHFVASPVCSPSRASIYTGKLLTNHGLWRNGCALPESQLTLAQAMVEAGRQTANFGKLHLVPLIRREGEHPPYGFEVNEVGEGDQQLTHDHYFRWLRMNHPNEFVAYLDETYKMQHARGFTSSIPEDCHLSTWVTQRSIDWLEHRRDPDRPFFLSVGYFDPHHAFNPCEPYASRFADTQIRQPRFQEGSIDTRPAHYRERLDGIGEHTRNPERMNATARAYHAMLAHVDKCVGDLVSALDRLGLGDNTVIVFTSDHGEFLGEHGLLWKGPFMLDDLLKVPLIIARPNANLDEGQTVTGLTSSLDLMATMLEISGTQAPSDTDGSAIVGLDLDIRHDALRDHVLAEWEDDEPSDTDSMRCIRTHEWKYVHYNHADESVGELYDLKADPGEFQNLYQEPAFANTRQDMFKLLERQYEHLDERPDVPYLGGW